MKNLLLYAFFLLLIVSTTAPSKSYADDDMNVRTVNADGTTTIKNPRIKYAGRMAPITIWDKDSAVGACVRFQLGDFVSARNALAPGIYIQDFAVIFNRDGSVHRYDVDEVVYWLTCKSR